MPRFWPTAKLRQSGVQEGANGDTEVRSLGDCSSFIKGWSNINRSGQRSIAILAAVSITLKPVARRDFGKAPVLLEAAGSAGAGVTLQLHDQVDGGLVPDRARAVPPAAPGVWL